ncbi:MAG: hypothetical protein M3077_14375 [Candidatus Dormibacteraeota bacterium]|nr:hypothetical protein [Candidatus Dormibacteraeota bacterium]
MKDQNPEQERQVATEQARQPQQDYPQEPQRQDSQQEYRQDAQSQQQPRQEFQRAEQRQPSRTDQATQTMEQPSGGTGTGSLIGNQEMGHFASQWTSIQAAFVDEPKKAVEQADKLVEDVIQHLSQTFARERQKLEGQWSRGDSASTEDLRVALQRYRQFFQSLLRT